MNAGGVPPIAPIPSIVAAWPKRSVVGGVLKRKKEQCYNRTYVPSFPPICNPSPGGHFHRLFKALDVLGATKPV